MTKGDNDGIVHDMANTETYVPLVDDLRTFYLDRSEDNAEQIVKSAELTKMLLNAYQRAHDSEGPDSAAGEVYRLMVLTTCKVPEMAQAVIQTLVAIHTQAEIERQSAFKAFDDLGAETLGQLNDIIDAKSKSE